MQVLLWCFWPACDDKGTVLLIGIMLTAPVINLCMKKWRKNLIACECHLLIRLHQWFERRVLCLCRKLLCVVLLESCGKIWDEKWTHEQQDQVYMWPVFMQNQCVAQEDVIFEQKQLSREAAFHWTKCMSKQRIPSVCVASCLFRSFVWYWKVSYLACNPCWLLTKVCPHIQSILWSCLTLVQAG